MSSDARLSSQQFPSKVNVLVSLGREESSRIGFVQCDPHPSVVADVLVQTGIDVSNANALSGRVRFSRSSFPLNTLPSGTLVVARVTPNYRSRGDHTASPIALASIFSFGSKNKDTLRVFPAVHFHLNEPVSVMLDLQPQKPLFPHFIDQIMVRKSSLFQEAENRDAFLIKMTSVDSGNLRGHVVAQIQEDVCHFIGGKMISLFVSPSQVVDLQTSAHVLKENFVYTVVRIGNKVGVLHENAPKSELLLSYLQPLVGRFLQLSDPFWDKFQTIKPSVTSQERLDLTHLATFSITDDDSEDVFEACSLEILDNDHVAVCIHAADVASYVSPESEIDRLFLSRMNIIKFSLWESVLPLSGFAQHVTLNPVVDGDYVQLQHRNVLTLRLVVSKTTAKVIDHNFCRSIIRPYCVTITDCEAVLVERCVFDHVIKSSDRIIPEEYKDVIAVVLPLLIRVTKANSVPVHVGVSSYRCHNDVIAVNSENEPFLIVTPVGDAKSRFEEEPTLTLVPSQPLRCALAHHLRQNLRDTYSHFATQFLRKHLPAPIVGRFRSSKDLAVHPLIEQLIDEIEVKPTEDYFQYRTNCIQKLHELYNSGALELPEFIDESHIDSMFLPLVFETSLEDCEIIVDPGHNSVLSFFSPLRFYYQLVLQRQLHAAIDLKTGTHYETKISVFNRHGLTKFYESEWTLKNFAGSCTASLRNTKWFVKRLVHTTLQNYIGERLVTKACVCALHPQVIVYVPLFRMRYTLGELEENINLELFTTIDVVFVASETTGYSISS
ncbi:hypothetical protein RCL1_001712 [Eukaryota sp. TZLM3-RCL]